MSLSALGLHSSCKQNDYQPLIQEQNGVKKLNLFHITAHVYYMLATGLSI